MISGGGRSAIALVLLTGVVGYAVVTHGGDSAFDSSLSLFLLGFVGLTGSAYLSTPVPSRDLDRILSIAVLLFPIYIAFQLAPLPLAVLKFISPARAEIAAALGGVGLLPRFAPLTISAASTWLLLARIAGCVLIFLLIHQIVRHSVSDGWIASLPLAGLAAMQALWAFAQAANGDPVLGTYSNRNHLAGLLEMVMPFAVVYGTGPLFKSHRRRSLTAADAVRVCCALGLALALFVAILFSLSKGGTFAALGSLVATSVLAIEGRVSGWRRWLATAGLVLGCVLIILFVTPSALVERFSSLASDDASEGRLPIWKDTLHMIRAYPLFGVGMGNFYPGLLRYQTSGLGFAWTAAHNDYLQFLSELGIVGFIFPAVIVAGALALALRAVFGAVEEGARDLGLACAGALAAFLIHSLSDFNSYVLANAMVFAWIVGIATGLAGVAERRMPVVSGSVRMRAEASGFSRGMLRAGAAVLGCLLIVYSGGWLIFLTRFHDNLAAERTFCRFGICDTETALAVLEGPHRETEPAPVPVDALIEFLRRDPAAPVRWSDLGTALQRAHRHHEAQYCMSRAVEMAPNSPPTLLAAADFLFDRGDRRAALDLVSRSLRAAEIFDEGIFSDLEQRNVPVADVIRYALPDRRSTQAYLRQLFTDERAADVDQLWPWMVGRGDADDKLANQYTEFRLRAERPEAAAQGWALYAKAKDPGYPEANRIFNGGFELDPAGNRFDWRVDARAGMAIDFDDGVRVSGRRSLRIRFDGTQNPGDIGLEQSVFLTPGAYRFEAHVRTEELSTDQGIAFRIVSEGGPKPLDVTTADLRGSKDWSVLEAAVDVPVGGVLARVLLTRKPSLKFDNLIKGTAWIDQVTLRNAH